MKAIIPLGQQTVYVNQYDAGLLFPIPRSIAREQLHLKDDLPFIGEDCWTGYEISWLDNQGKPQVRLAEFYFNYDSPNIVESKSFKLYLNSFNQTCFDNEKQVSRRMQDDLSAASGKPCRLIFYPMCDAGALAIEVLPGRCIDGIEVSIQDYEPNPELLKVNSSTQVEGDIIYSHLLKTNCPVTRQPDWATVFVEYSGDEINAASLLAYVISFREHQDFHENCVERLFCDIQQYCQPTELSICARYTRRGGLDINPLRTNTVDNQLSKLDLRISRQ
jgi:7-cyano-7-deazaguanine reductase